MIMHCHAAIHHRLITRDGLLIKGMTRSRLLAAPLLLIALNAALPISAHALEGERRLEGHQYNVCTVRFSPDGKRLLTGSPGLLLIHDAVSGETVRKIDLMDGSGGGAAFSPDGKRIAVEVDGWFKVFDSETGKEVFTTSDAHDFGFTSHVVSYSPDGQYVVVSHGIVNPNTGSLVAVFQDETGDDVRFEDQAMFLPGGHRLAAIEESGHRRCLLLDLPPLEKAAASPIKVTVRPGDMMGSAVKALAVSPDGRLLATAGINSVQFWNTTDRKPLGDPLAFPHTYTPTVGFSPDGKYLAVATRKQVVVFDVDSRKETRTVSAENTHEDIFALTFSPDGTQMLVGLKEHPSAILWNLRAEVGATAGATRTAADTGRSDAQKTKADTSAASADIPASTQPATPEQKRRATEVVKLLIGTISDHYNEFGYKGVTLGKTFDELNQITPLVNRGEWTGLDSIFEKSDGDTGETFIFDDKDRLVAYGRRYAGGPDDYMGQLIELFGKPDVHRIGSSDTTLNYSFPKVLARVVFDEEVRPGGVLHLTHVFVVDRAWVEGILSRTAVNKAIAIDWLKAASVLASQGVRDPSAVPALPGTRMSEDRECLRFIDTEREKELEPVKKWHGFAAVWAACASVEVSERHGIRAASLHCGRYSRTRLGPVVKEARVENENATPRKSETVQEAPILGDLLWILNQVLLERAFPPMGDKVTRLRSPGVAERFEWTSLDDERNSWRVKCAKDLEMRVEFLGQKKL